MSWLRTYNRPPLITGCVQRPRDVNCRAGSSRRAVFKRVKGSSTLWQVRTYANQLPDADTGPRVPGTNPIGVPIQVTVVRPMQSAMAQTSACRAIRYERLICRP